jgi:hypothetical protein
VSRGQRGGFPTVVNLFSRPEPLLFLSSSSLFMLTSLSRPRSRLTATQKIWKRWGIEHRTSGLAARNSDHYTTEAVGGSITEKSVRQVNNCTRPPAALSEAQRASVAEE